MRKPEMKRKASVCRVGEDRKQEGCENCGPLFAISHIFGALS